MLRKSKVVASVPASNMLSPDLDELSESLPMAPPETDDKKSSTSVFGDSAFAFGGGVVIFILAVFLVRYVLRKRRGAFRPRTKTRDYMPVPGESEELEDLVAEDGSEEYEMVDPRLSSKKGG